MYDLDEQRLAASIRMWLEEDVGAGDITSAATIPADHRSRGILHTKESGVIAGLPVVARVFGEVDPSLVFMPAIGEGARVKDGAVVAEVTGSTRSILRGERLALNLLQRLSGIATRTRTFVDALAGAAVRLVDTRKTTPGHRMLEKYAVRVGGGYNHRYGLSDAVMIKDNHIKASGGIAAAVSAARRRIPHTMKIEVETESLRQVEEALQAGADIIMLDNMEPGLMKEAARLIKRRAPHTCVEASGGVTLETVGLIAATGVDVISVGGLTHSIRSLDISLDLNERKGLDT